jgi:hypothetical protein
MIYYKIVGMSDWLAGRHVVLLLLVACIYLILLLLLYLVCTSYTSNTTC